MLCVSGVHLKTIPLPTRIKLCNDSKSCNKRGKCTLWRNLENPRILPEITWHEVFFQPWPGDSGQQEASPCQWTQKYYPTQKTGVCSLSHIRAHAKLLNAASELSPLREVLDGKHAGKDFAEPDLLARECPDAFGSVRACKYVRSFSQQAYILFGTKSFFGFGQKVFAVVALTDATGIHLAGRAMTGKRRGDAWEAEDFVEVAADALA